VIQFDADGQHDVQAIVYLVEACERHDWDLCIGSRFLQQEAGGFQSTLPRRLGIRFLSALIRLLSGVRVTDPTSGLRCAGPRAWMDFAQNTRTTIRNRSRCTGAYGTACRWARCR